ncbi:MAG: hypothetical protein K0S54_2698 [Alphaproteobacteria bacterium]|jgi:uncharacterized protein (TIGR00251 family)|nr:hypothetical protein [Alphaproteobacteria bacterium]
MRPVFTATRDGAIQFAVRVSPRSSRQGIEGLIRDENGAKFLKVAVNAPPEDGKANKEVLALLASTIGIAKSRLSLVSGETARKKVLRLEAVDAALLARLNDWINTLEYLK